MPGIARSEGSAPIRGVLLAAGAGTRLRPLTGALPKAAMPLLDVPLGSFGLRMLERSVGTGIAMNVSHLGSAAREALAPLVTGLEILDEGRIPLGTAGTLAALRARMAERIVVVNGDLVTDLDLADLIAAHQRIGAPATVAVATVPGRADFRGADGRLTGFIDRRAGSSGAPGFLYLGAGVFERAAIDLIPDAGARRAGSAPSQLGLAEVVLRPLADKGLLGYHVHDGYARDVGTLPRYLEASLDLLAGRGPTFGAPGKVVGIEGGRAYIGPGALAADDRLGPGAVVLAGARAEGRVRRAVVWPGEYVPPTATVEDAIWFRGAPQPAEGSG